MPYDSAKDNILKQLCEVQLLMTLLVSIVLRTELSDDLLGESGYDMILVGVNALMVPGFMLVASIVGLYMLLYLVYKLLHKQKWIKTKTDAVHEIVSGQVNSIVAKQLKHEVMQKVKEEKHVQIEKSMRLASQQEIIKKEREDLFNKFDQHLRPYVTDFHRGAFLSA